MAAKTMMLRAKIDDAKKELSILETRMKDFQKREEELEKAIEEAETDEEKQEVDEAVNAFEDEKNEAETEKANIEQQIAELERELKETESKQRATQYQKKEEKREVSNNMETSEKFFGMSDQQRDAFFARQDVKDFLTRLREIGMEKRAVTGGELTIPVVMLGILRQNIGEFSKLYKHVWVRQIRGTGRMIIEGDIPEGVWTEACGALNELDITFMDVQIDGYKVGGFIPVCNALLQDSDIALAQEIMTALGRAIGYALDKAILFGTGRNMPLGILPRLEEETDPNQGTTSMPWEDLHETNIQSSNKTGIELFKDFLLASGSTQNKYVGGNKFWAMNENTFRLLQTYAMTTNMAGMMVSSINTEMPIVGGRVEIIDFVPDNMIIGGYGQCYVLAEREGVNLRQSEHVQFIKDRTVFAGTARYDGLPAIPKGFAAFGINGTTPSSATITFAMDTANDATLEEFALLSQTLSPAFNPTTQSYTVTASGTSSTVSVAAAQPGANVSLKFGKEGQELKPVGSDGEITFSSNGKYTLEVTVTNGNSEAVYTTTITKS